MNPSQTSRQDVNVHLSSDPPPAPPPDPVEAFVRLPGLLRRWEIEQVVQPFADYQIEAAGKTADGTEVFAVYHRAHTPEDDTDASVPVTVSFENGQGPVRARFMPLGSGDPLMGLLVVSHDPDDAKLQSRVRDHLAHTIVPPVSGPPLSISSAGTPPTEASSCSRKT